MIFLPELSVDLREKVVKAGTEQKNWVERTKRIFICPDHTGMVAGKVIYFIGISCRYYEAKYFPALNVILVKITTFLNLLLGKTGRM